MSSGADPSSHPGGPPDAAPPTRDELLAEVLGETIHRGRQDPESLLRAVRDWKSEMLATRGTHLDAERFAELIGVVLRQRLGDKAAKLPERLRREVADVLWNDPTSRGRIERLWAAVDATP